MRGIAIKLLFTFIFASIVCGIAYAYTGYATYSYSGVKTQSDERQIQIEMKGAAIAPTSSISIDYRYVGDFNLLDFYVNEVSTGSITTANVDWVLSGGTVITSNTLTSGTAKTSMLSSFLKLTIYNYKDITANVTGNIIFVKK